MTLLLLDPTWDCGIGYLSRAFYITGISKNSFPPHFAIPIFGCAAVFLVLPRPFMPLSKPKPGSPTQLHPTANSSPLLLIASMSRQSFPFPPNSTPTFTNPLLRERGCFRHSPVKILRPFPDQRRRLVFTLSKIIIIPLPPRPSVKP